MRRNWARPEGHNFEKDGGKAGGAVLSTRYAVVALALTALMFGVAVGGEPRRLTTVETLVGMWTGRWEAAGGAAGGSLGVILSRVPGRETVIGQFTFVDGAVSRTMRYEGQLENGVVRFALVDRGWIVLEVDPKAQRAPIAPRLSGTWVESRGALPAPRGTMELERTS